MRLAVESVEQTPAPVSKMQARWPSRRASSIATIRRRPLMTTTSTSGAQAGLDRADAEQRRAAARRRCSSAAARPEQRSVHVEIEAAHGAAILAGTGRAAHLASMAMAITRSTEPWTALLDGAREDGRLVREAFEGAREPAFAELPADLHPALPGALASAGIERLYAHQAAALESAWEATTIVTTGHRVGQVAVLPAADARDAARRPARPRALPLPDEGAGPGPGARAARLRAAQADLRPAIYDGDTPREERAAIRRRSNLVLTNPDMLHVGVLPHHARWGDLFANLALVVVDEAHVYRGVFGSHVANVLRRLRRIAGAYGTTPRFLLASATIANPVELAERLTGLDDVRLIDEDGSPGARREIAMWNPPLEDEALQTRRSVLAEAAEIVARLVREGARTICFMKSRKGVELVAKMAADELSRSGDRELAERVAAYRAGYTPQQRRELEARLVSGELLAVVTTDALELGIDIGALDAAVCVTFPGTVASLRQMWGRAGRRGRGLAVYVAGEDALDQFFCRHPDEFLDRPVEAAILHHENEHIHLPHLLCAAHEGPIDPDDDAEVLGPRVRAHCEALAAQGSLIERRGRFTLRAPGGLPGGARRRCARARRRASRSSTRCRASCSATSSSRAPARPCTTAPSTCTWAASTRSASSTSRRGARSSSRSAATGTRSPSARSTPTSSGCSTAASAAA